MEKTKEFLSVAELAKKLKISRIAVHKRIKKGQIKAIRIGRTYAVSEETVTDLLGETSGESLIKTGEIAIYKSSEGRPEIKVILEKDTIWLTQSQIASLFDIDRSVITKHIKNIFDSEELDEKSNVQKMHIAFSDKLVKYYTLDMIISVGYRVNSKRATDFRIWATGVLKQHIVKGYTINEMRLKQAVEKFFELQKAVSFIRSKAMIPVLEGQQKELLSIIDDYSRSMTILNEYDEGKLAGTGKAQAAFALAYDDCVKIINETKQKLMEKGEAGDLFGQEASGKLKGIIGTLYQTFGGKELYPTTEEKAAHILYLIIKDHPFIDGNKRMGSILFIYFLSRNNYLLKSSGEAKINDNALAALALLVATSDPKEKDIIIKIIISMLL